MEEEAMETVDGAESAAESAALHARLVALVRAAGGEPEGRVGVWMEHSYARAKSGAGAMRVLLARPPEPDDNGVIDVGGGEDDVPPADKPAADDGDPDWEARVLALAPTPAHLRAARAATAALLALRLARLAGAGVADASVRRDGARAAARQVRRALAPLWAGGGGAPTWLHGALLAHAGRSDAALWREVAAELRRAVPRLAARLLPLPQPPPEEPLAQTGPAVGAGASGPWLVWVCAGGPDRWVRRLRALLHVRVVSGGAGATSVAGAPEAWCAAAAGAVRAGLLAALADAGPRPVVVGGAGAGAALCGALLAGAGAASGAGAGSGAGGDLSGVRALALLAPPLLTAEGEVTHLHRNELDLPLLVVAGSAGAACARSAACELLAGGTGASAARRVVVVRGADDALRLPARLRRRRQVPQHALDAAIAEEVARWALTAAEGEVPRRVTRKGAAAAELTDDRHSTLHNARGLLREVEPATESTRPVRAHGLPRRTTVAPVAPPAPAPVALNSESSVEELDIMQLPIVFADDEPAPAPKPPPIKRQATATVRPSVTVTSGHPRGGRALNYTRVIVAKRRGGAGARGASSAGAGSATATTGAPGAPGTARGGRPVLLRRTVRLVRDP